MIIATLALLAFLFGGGGSLENYLLNIKKFSESFRFQHPQFT